MTIREKPHRLPNSFYQGEQIVSFTISVKDRKKIFTNLEIFKTFEEILLQEVEKQSSDSLIHLFMPDHLHVVLESKQESSNVIDAINSFKQKAGYWYSKNRKDVIWQKNYYDHILRNVEDLKNHIYYILYNPIRAEICEDWKSYPFKGSTVYNFDEWER